MLQRVWYVLDRVAHCPLLPVLTLCEMKTVSDVQDRWSKMQTSAHRKKKTSPCSLYLTHMMISLAMSKMLTAALSSAMMSFDLSLIISPDTLLPTIAREERFRFLSSGRGEWSPRIGATLEDMACVWRGIESGTRTTVACRYDQLFD